MGLQLLEVKSLVGHFIGWENTSSGELDVESKILGRLNIGGTEVWLTQNCCHYMGELWAALIIIALILRAKMKNYKYKPEGLQNVVEMAIESMHNFVVGSMTEKYAYFGNWFFGVFVFVLVSNLSGLLGLRAPTADFLYYCCNNSCYLCYDSLYGYQTGKGGYFKGYLEPVPVLLPINIISELATPISLSFRLFGNIFRWYDYYGNGLLFATMVKLWYSGSSAYLF